MKKFAEKLLKDAQELREMIEGRKERGMEALELNAFFEAGLKLCGQEKDGSLQFMGTREQWERAWNTIRFNRTWR